MPPTMPPSISGTVNVTKVRAGETPRLIEASSKLGSSWCRIALEARTLKGSFRTI